MISSIIIRLSNQEVAFMIDVLFITPTTELKLSHESNGTLILATLLRQAGISARILRFAQLESYNKDYALFLKEITEHILSIKPRCVSFYTLWPYYHIMLRIAKDLKLMQPELSIVLGGPQASATAEATMHTAPYVDYICCGEGETTVVPFFQALLSGNESGVRQIPGLLYRCNGQVVSNSTSVDLCDLNTLPHWDEELYIHDYCESQEKLSSPDYFMPIDAGRGCPYSCTFCCTSYFWKRTYRLKSAERISADIRYYKERFGITSFWFSHDAFTSNMKLVEEVCDQLIENDLQVRWRCTSRVDRLSESLILKMKQAGMVQIELGIESGSADMQRRINKNLDLKKAERMIDFLLAQKITVTLFFMYGFPDETEEELAQTLTLQLNLLDKGVRYTSMSFCKFNPSTAITEKYFDQLELDPSCEILVRGLSFGYKEELPVIAGNKEMFPFFYHLNTPVRNRYQYLECLNYLYNKYPQTCRRIRTLFSGDDLRFYREFCEANADIFSGSMTQIERAVVDRSQQMLDNLLDRHMDCGGQQLKAMLQYECDQHQLKRTAGDTVLRKTYDFIFAEYLLKVPATRLTGGKTELLLLKQNGAISQKLISMS